MGTGRALFLKNATHFPLLEPSLSRKRTLSEGAAAIGDLTGTESLAACLLLKEVFMRTSAAIQRKGQRQKEAFLLVEAVIGMALLGLVFMAMYTGLCTTAFSLQLSRENLRATQLMTEKLETVRLYGWKKIDDPLLPLPRGFNYQVPVYPDDPSLPGNNATPRTFDVDLTIDKAPVTEIYANDLRLVTIKLAWQTGKLKRTRTMSTLVSKYGLNRYVY